MRSNADSACEICGGKGYIFRKTQHYPDGAQVQCRCLKRTHAWRKTSALAQRSGLDEALLERYTFDRFHPEAAIADAEGRRAIAEVQAICERYAARPKGWLVLSGSYGCGKTHLAYAVAGVLLNARRPVYIASVPQLLQTLREGYDKASREEVGDGARALRGQTCEERLALIQTAGLLILDDLGAEYRTPWVADTLYRIVDYRYLSKLPLMVTTNVNLRAAQDRIEPRLLSRLLDGAWVEGGWSRVCVLTAGDYRQRRGVG
jgi:DNA replication protein DnaC